jgi:hypothetical protein
MLMTNQNVTRRCLRLLDDIAGDVKQATAFGPEARDLHDKLAELRTLLDEFVTGSLENAVLHPALEVREFP